MTQDEFLIRARLVHGESYDYSRVVVSNSKTKVEIVCRTCAQAWWVLTGNHIFRRSACPRCSQVKMKFRSHDPTQSFRNTRKTHEEFLAEARARHGHAYNYDKVEYITNKVRVVITCLKCSLTFEQMPICHIGRGHGCPRCAREIISTSKVENQWVRQAQCSQRKASNMDDCRVETHLCRRVLEERSI